MRIAQAAYLGLSKYTSMEFRSFECGAATNRHYPSVALFMFYVDSKNSICTNVQFPRLDSGLHFFNTQLCTSTLCFLESNQVCPSSVQFVALAVEPCMNILILDELKPSTINVLAIGTKGCGRVTVLSLSRNR